MQNIITFLQNQFDFLVSHLLTEGDEQAAFLLGKQTITTDSINLLVRSIIPVEESDIISSSPTHMSIRSATYLRVLKRADLEGSNFVFVHSHPTGIRQFSAKDNEEETALFKTAYIRIHHDIVHGSLVFTNKDTFSGRFWMQDGTTSEVERIRVIGNRFQYLFSESLSEVPLEFFDRQALAFTSALQPILKRLHIGIVGVGGTGSAVCEQLIRLGIGKLTIIDAGTFEKSNTSRVYGSTAFDEHVSKANIAGRLAASIGLCTEVNCIHGHLGSRSTTRRLLDCDVVFGCTDDEWGRSILNRLSYRHYIPVFDMGVSIDTDNNNRIVSAQARVTTLLPGTACLCCRKRISSEGIRTESIAFTDPVQASLLRKEGYLKNINERAPSVISFTTQIAAAAVSEFLHRLTAFQGVDRIASEIIYLLDQSRIRTNSTPPSPNCLCSDKARLGVGDTKRFLDLNWAIDEKTTI